MRKVRSYFDESVKIESNDGNVIELSLSHDIKELLDEADKKDETYRISRDNY